MKLKLRWAVLGSILIAIGLAIWFSLTWQSVHNVRVTFLNVGQGDAILIQAPGGYDVLIDGGPDTTVVEKLGERLPYFDRTIELLVVTHPDSDHVAGLVEVSRRYRVQRLLGTLVADELPAYNLLFEQLSEQGTDKIAAQPGMSFNLPEANLTVLGPPGNHVGETPKDSNELSVVVRLDSQDHSFLFTGDADFKEEAEILVLPESVQSDVLKVGHHGSKSSSSEQWIKAVQPVFGIISAGLDNRYGHPSQETIERLEKVGVVIHSTIEEGDICIEVIEGKLGRC